MTGPRGNWIFGLPALDTGKNPKLTQAQRDLLAYGEMYPGDRLSAFRTPGCPERFAAVLRVYIRDKRRMSGVIDDWRVTET